MSTVPETVAVAGSCVTRDNFNSRFNPGYKRWYDVRLSANQTSMIALMSPPITDDFEPLREMSDYDRWNVGSDLRREFLPELAALQPDVLLPDFFGDVHMGVAQLPDGRWFTDNRWKVQHTDFYRDHRDAGDLTLLKHTADPDAYFALWVEAMDRFAAYVAETCPRTRVVVHRGWNTGQVLVPGRPRLVRLRRHKQVSPLDVDGANAFWARLDDHCVTAYGWEQIDLRDLRAPTYDEHPWGAFYVHYTPDYYHRFLADLLTLSLHARAAADDDTADRVETIRQAAAEPAERRLALAETALAVVRRRSEQQGERVAELEALGLVGSVRYAAGRRLRARRGRADA